MASVSMRDLLEAGVHFGHQTSRWNPKMKPYIFGSRNGIHIINLQKTIRMFRDAIAFVQRVVSRGDAVLFVGTKRQAQDVDRQRRAFLTRYFHHDVADPHEYDFVVNVEKFAQRDAVDLIVSAVQGWQQTSGVQAPLAETCEV